MALIEVFHVVATELPIDATGSPDLPQGMLVGLDANGNIQLCDGTTDFAMGIAGDSRSSGTTSFTPESNSALSRNPKTSLTGALVTGAFGAQQRFTQNRVADNFNEVLASGKMTVYHGGGEFWTDQYETIGQDGSSVREFVPGTRLWCSQPETAGTNDTETNNGGRFTDEGSTINQIVGFTLRSPTNYPSGVPGTDTPFSTLPEGGNSLTWGLFLHVKLVI